MAASWGLVSLTEMIGSLGGIDHPSDVPTSARGNSALLTPTGIDTSPGFAHIEILSQSGSPREMAANLFAAMRRLDGGPYHCIYAQRLSEGLEELPDSLGRDLPFEGTRPRGAVV